MSVNCCHVWNICIRKLSSECTVTLADHYLSDQIKNEMGGTCNMCEEDDRCIYGFSGET